MLEQIIDLQTPFGGGNLLGHGYLFFFILSFEDK